MGGQLRSQRRETPAAEPVQARPESDDVVLVQAAQMNPAAFAPLYARYLAPVYRYCYLRLGSRETAEDATSEVFIRVLAALPGYQVRGVPFAAWLFRIAHNVVVDRRRRSHPAAPLAAADRVADRAPTPEEAAVARAEQAALRTALAALSDDQRAMVELQLAGWSGPQIAAALGKRPEAARMLRFRALSRLRILLKEAADDRA